jgi:Tfp pilus assembly protein PilF
MAVILILKLKKYSPNRADSLNNFAFVLLHQGDVAKAKHLLESAINKGEGGSHVLANYALCLAASGDSTQVNKYISASEFYASSDHDKSIVLFNKAIISLTQGNEEKFINELKEAVKKSKNEIFSYLNYSEFTKEIIKKSEIKEAISLI